MAVGRGAGMDYRSWGVRRVGGLPLSRRMLVQKCKLCIDAKERGRVEKKGHGR